MPLCLEITQLSLIFVVADPGDGTHPPQPGATSSSLNTHLIYALREEDLRLGATPECV